MDLYSVIYGLVLLSVVIERNHICGGLKHAWEGSGDTEDGDSEDDVIPSSGGGPLSSKKHTGSNTDEQLEEGSSISDDDDDEDSKDGDEDGTYSSVKNNYVRDKVDEFLSIVEEYEKNKDTCEPGVQFNLGDGVITQYGVNRFKAQALLAVNRANLLTRLWKGMSEEFLKDEYFFYTQVRSIVEGDDDIFAAGNCYDEYEFENYTLFCPYAFRMPNNSDMIMVKDLASGYPYLGNDSEFFLLPRRNAYRKLNTTFATSYGK